ncbi:hypothetical protein [Paractinoplanes durhamensis]|uniref:DUF4878 domain-containing protein n=1 Tax=Paractinoplanes durhamensis TaxID=113563 RepID=A0ABQ3Z8H5_9ACTN|nr:hypothetical protein [Actinoplanes durhamensis]GIE06144.1 hypothetical protein Adu01nite_74940 [Actinoplanes durhamensis]
MTTASHVPAPPQGPGVYPPFPAPPVEGKGKRIGWGIGIAAGVIVLICGGGTAALIGIGVSTSGSLQERAEAAVGDYLDAVAAKRYDQAYGLLCDDAQQDESAAEFRTRVTGEQTITDYTFGDLNFVTLALPVDATYSDGATAELEAYLGQDTSTGAFEVCRLGE